MNMDKMKNPVNLVNPVLLLTCFQYYRYYALPRVEKGTELAMPL